MMTTGSEQHEARMAALMKRMRFKDRFSRLSVEFLMGRKVTSPEAQRALQDAPDARNELAAIDGSSASHA
jgi:hypothetical protein